MFDYRKDKNQFNEFITKTCCDSEELCRLNVTKLKILGLLLCEGSNYTKSDCLYELICSKNKQNMSLSWNNRHYSDVLNQLLEVSLQVEIYYTEKPDIACYKSAQKQVVNKIIDQAYEFESLFKKEEWIEQV